MTTKDRDTAIQMLKDKIEAVTIAIDRPGFSETLRVELEGYKSGLAAADKFCADRDILFSGDYIAWDYDKKGE